jgi:hypothetical protein
LMPLEMAQQLARTLVESLIKASQQTRATPEPVTEPTDKFDDWSDRLSLNNPSRFRSWVQPTWYVMGRRLVGGIYIVQAALGGSPRSGPNFQLFLSGQLRPMLRLPKEEFAVLFIICASRVPLALPGVF